VTALVSSRHARHSHGGRRGRSAESPVDVADRSLFDDGGGEPTLDELVSGVWQGLIAHQRVPCPWCGADMTPVYSAHARPTAGRCAGCETTLD
jgi:hypothetical protein